MARKLPWNTTERAAGKLKKPRVKPKPKQTVESESLDEEETERSREVPKLKVSKKHVRSSSNTAAEESEIERTMEEGIAHDDIYMMVEDEFLATAKKFTREIHQAALDKMEEAAKLKSRDAISSISRPVSTAMPSQTRRKLEAIARGKKQGEGVQKLLSKVPRDDDDGNEDDLEEAVPAWIGTSLHGLMEAPKKLEPSLARFGITQSEKNATGGKGFSMEKDEDETASEDEYDLDAVPKAPKAKQLFRPEPEPRKSLFSKIKPNHTSSINATMQSSINKPSEPKDSSIIKQPSEVEKAVSSVKVLEETTLAPASKPADESTSTLAQIKKRAAERRRRANS